MAVSLWSFRPKRSVLESKISSDCFSNLHFFIFGFFIYLKYIKKSRIFGNVFIIVERKDLALTTQSLLRGIVPNLWNAKYTVRLQWNLTRRNISVLLKVLIHEAVYISFLTNIRMTGLISVGNKILWQREMCSPIKKNWSSHLYSW